eukprot:2794036-Rhodomonas_salina.1
MARLRWSCRFASVRTRLSANNAGHDVSRLELSTAEAESARGGMVAGSERRMAELIDGLRAENSAGSTRMNGVACSSRAGPVREMSGVEVTVLCPSRSLRSEREKLGAQASALRLMHHTLLPDSDTTAVPAPARTLPLTCRFKTLLAP